MFIDNTVIPEIEVQYFCTAGSLGGGGLGG